MKRILIIRSARFEVFRLSLSYFGQANYVIDVVTNKMGQKAINNLTAEGAEVAEKIQNVFLYEGKFITPQILNGDGLQGLRENDYGEVILLSNYQDFSLRSYYQVYRFASKIKTYRRDRRATDIAKIKIFNACGQVKEIESAFTFFLLWSKGVAQQGIYFLLYGVMFLITILGTVYGTLRSFRRKAVYVTTKVTTQVHSSRLQGSGLQNDED